MRWTFPFLTMLLLVAMPAVSRGESNPAFSLGESFPIETTLDDPAMPEAHDIWVKMIRGAKKSADFAQFYVVNTPGGRMEPVLEAIADASKRGVKVRFIADAKFAKTYPESLDWLSTLKNVEVRRYDMKPITGGVQHAKYFVIDGKDAWIGSQNFDWRSLTHIQELGARISAPNIIEPLSKVFELDWSLAGGGERPAAVQGDAAYELVPLPPALSEGAEDTLTFAASPRALLPEGVVWDLPYLIGAINGAKERVRIQVMSYALVGYDKEYWDDLDRALRAAAARRVEVELLVADWNKKSPKVEGLQSLAVLPHMTVKFVTIPPWSGGFVDFARVIHAKYMVVDGRWSWLGTGNWSSDYFLSSRNVSVVVNGTDTAKKLDAWFERLWNSDYAEAVDPCGHYDAPKTK